MEEVLSVSNVSRCGAAARDLGRTRVNRGRYVTRLLETPETLRPPHRAERAENSRSSKLLTVAFFWRNRSDGRSNRPPEAHPSHIATHDPLELPRGYPKEEGSRSVALDWTVGMTSPCRLPIVESRSHDCSGPKHARALQQRHDRLGNPDREQLQCRGQPIRSAASHGQA